MTVSVGDPVIRDMAATSSLLVNYFVELLMSIQREEIQHYCDNN